RSWKRSSSGRITCVSPALACRGPCRTRTGPIEPKGGSASGSKTGLSVAIEDMSATAGIQSLAHHHVFLPWWSGGRDVVQLVRFGRRPFHRAGSVVAGTGTPALEGHRTTHRPGRRFGVLGLRGPSDRDHRAERGGRQKARRVLPRAHHLPGHAPRLLR